MSIQYPITGLTRDQLDALEGTNGAPSDVNRFVTSEDPILLHGDQAGGNLHALATTSTAGFMSAEDKQRLDEFITPGALSENRYDIYTNTVQTSSTSNITYRTWVTPTDVEPGTYLVKWIFKFRTAAYQYPGYFTINVDGSQLIQVIMAAAYSSTEVIGAIAVGEATFTSSAPHTFTVLFRAASSTSGRWTELRSSYIELTRVV